jgi:hypothetical protein
MKLEVILCNELGESHKHTYRMVSLTVVSKEKGASKAKQTKTLKVMKVKRAY